MGPLRFRKDELNVTFTRPFQMKRLPLKCDLYIRPLHLERSGKGVVKVTFTKS